MKKYLASFYIETEVGPKILSKVVRCIEDTNARDILMLYLTNVKIFL